MKAATPPAQAETTASVFWKAFDDAENEVPSSLAPVPLESLRLRCVYGFLALEATLACRFRAIFALDWAETVSYLRAFLAEPARLAPLVEGSQGVFSRAQWFSTLRFLASTGEPRDFSPTFADVGVLMTLLSPQPAVTSPILTLFRLQKLRNSALHTGRAISEIELREAVKLLREAQKTWQAYPVSRQTSASMDRKAA